MNRFFVSQPLTDGNIFLDEPDLIHQIRKVLRLGRGDKIILLDNSGAEFDAEIAALDRKTLGVRILAKRENRNEPELRVNLFQSLPNSPAKFEEILKHATEIGIAGFFPVIAERSESRKLWKVERLAKILRESAEQSERGRIPTLAEPRKFGKIWDEPPAGLNLIADSFSREPLLQNFRADIRNFGTTNIFVGPEGGWSEKEIELAKKCGAKTFSLGRRILRTETAGIAIASAIFFG